MKENEFGVACGKNESRHYYEQFAFIDGRRMRDIPRRE
jgi:hypothetical protein